MPAIDFPNSPTIGQQFTSGSTTWIWDGVAWDVTRTAVVGPTGPTGPASTVQGPTGPTGASGVISVTGPITNTGTSTAAVIGLDKSLITSDDITWSVFSTFANLPIAGDNHGMFAHVHDTGSAYYAHAGNWVKLVIDTDARLSDTRTPTDLSVTTAKIVDGNVTNVKLENSSVTIGSTSVSLGGTAATISGLTLTSPTVSGLYLSDSSITVEGTANNFETTLSFTDATSDVTVTVPAENTTLLGTHLIGAKGDLLVGTGISGLTNLAVGANLGYVLAVDSATPTGLVWKNAFEEFSGSVNQNTSIVDVYPRIGNFTGTPTSGTVYLTMFTPTWTTTISSISVAAATIATTGTSLVRFGLYTVSGNTATLVARTASDTTLFSTTNTLYTRALNSDGGYPNTYTLLAGTRYAIGLIVIASTTGSIQMAWSSIPGTLSTLSPRITGALASQSDLPSSIGSMSPSTISVWGRFS